MPPIARRSVVDEAIDDMRQRITSGEWPLGSRIPPESLLVAELGLSRAPLREAVRALVHAGLLITRQGDGTFVSATNERALALHRGLSAAREQDIIETRQALDITAAGLAAQRRTQEDLQQLADALERRRIAAVANDIVAFRTADVDFHRAVFAATHNELLKDIYATLTEVIEVDWITGVGVERAALAEHDNHDEIYEAIRRGDHQEAVAAVASILDRHVTDLQAAVGSPAVVPPQSREKQN
ncbi:FadR/GntR family transcriptional regulator [Paeniglutamicibacter kerguelensis]|uniref:DNA-binding FadR family transcriptional regulator n=1 Tax=Paeniglutamicibacter kerguelensis TaxID=254788 RepID=A0ABS4X9R0_9MICC|nr:FadR/GntR family transcriptional regulator [Paeniglutamicibacter kerguelensis]MBP2385202.1 DNA-binding FadR family transcriptional regulator [Paeniglutamicibacter kerguelensis]